MQPSSPHDEILEDYLSMQRQRDHTVDPSSLSFAPRERMALLKLAYKTALDRAASLTIAGVALEDVDPSARICPITFNHGCRVDSYRLLEPSRVHDELLMLWAKKMGLVPFDEQQQQQAAALNTLTNVQPIEGMLRRFMDADDAVILPTTEVLQRMAPILEQRLANNILSGKNGWSLDTDFSKESLLHSAKIPIADDVTLSNSSIPDSHKWAPASDFIYVALRRPEDSKKGLLLRPSVTSHWKDRATMEHYFEHFISTYPTIIGPELPIFPSFLSLAAAVGVYVFRVKAVRRIEGWEGFFVAHHDVAMYIAHLLCAASKASFRRALKLRPKNSTEKHADVKAFERLPEDDESDEVVTRGFPCRAGCAASKTVAKEGSNLSRDVGPAHKKQKLAEYNESEGSGSPDRRQRREPSLSPIKLARLNFTQAAIRLDLALEALFDAGQISLLDLLLGWQAVNVAVGGDKARELVDLRLAKSDAFDAVEKARRAEEVEEAEDEVRGRALLRGVSPATTWGSSARSSSPEERGAGGEGWTCLADADE